MERCSLFGLLIGFFKRQQHPVCLGFLTFKGVDGFEFFWGTCRLPALVIFATTVIKNTIKLSQAGWRCYHRNESGWLWAGGYSANPIDNSDLLAQSINWDFVQWIYAFHVDWWIFIHVKWSAVTLREIIYSVRLPSACVNEEWLTVDFLI